MIPTATSARDRKFIASEACLNPFGRVPQATSSQGHGTPTHARNHIEPTAYPRRKVGSAIKRRRPNPGPARTPQIVQRSSSCELSIRTAGSVRHDNRVSREIWRVRSSACAVHLTGPYLPIAYRVGLQPDYWWIAPAYSCSAECNTTSSPCWHDLLKRQAEGHPLQKPFWQASVF